MSSPIPQLDSIRVLYRQSDTMTLWGVPYDMRPGQSPGDIRRAGNIGIGGSPQWVYLGEPGWYGGEITRADLDSLKQWVASKAALGAVPEWPEEWSRLADFD